MRLGDCSEEKKRKYEIQYGHYIVQAIRRAHGLSERREKKRKIANDNTNDSLKKYQLEVLCNAKIKILKFLAGTVSTAQDYCDQNVPCFYMNVGYCNIYLLCRFI